MNQVYMSRIEGHQRIHVEIADHEIAGLLDDLRFPEQGDAFESTNRLRQILVDAAKTFGLYGIVTDKTTEETK